MAKKKTTENKKAGAAAPVTGTSYVVLARKYRPQTFDDLIGQDAMVQTLSNAFAIGRIAQGYMLTGVRGVGKTTTARILARALNYETEDVTWPTVEMPKFGRHCAEIMESRHPDVIEMDAASHTGVDNMRELIENARYRPLLARNKIYIIDEVHMLSKGAFNALLKTLEEPPEHVRFIFATTEIRKVPVTVLSRCQRFDLRRIDVPLLIEHFAKITQSEGTGAERSALALIARAAEGSVRDGLSILDQAIAMGSGKVTDAAVREMLGLADRGRIFDLLDDLFGGAAGNAVKALGALYRDGADAAQILADLAEAVHVAARVKAVGSGPAGESLSAEEKRRAEKLAGTLSVPLLSRAWQMLIKGLEDAQRSPDPVAAAEMVLIRIAYTADLPSPDEIIKALDNRRETDPHDRALAQPQPASEIARTAGYGTGATASAGEVAEVTGASDVMRRDKGSGGGNSTVEGPGRTQEPVQVRSFEDVIALAGAHRDAKLKLHLEEHVSLVKFDAAAGAIDLFLIEGAPSAIANDLREKLNAWTKRKWVVVLSPEMGEVPAGAARRRKEATEFDVVTSDPAVAAVLKHFPEAEIVAISSGTEQPDDDTATG